MFIISVREQFTKPEFHKIKGILFLSFGISAGLPIIHSMIFDVNGFNSDDFSFFYWFLGGFCYIFGAILYIIRVPERWFPGKFCIIGNSHQIFHIFVLFGVFSHYYACLNTYQYRYNNLCN